MVTMTSVPVYEAGKTGDGGQALASVPTARLYRAQFIATARLQLWFTAETHRIFAAFSEQARNKVLSYADKDGKLDSLSGFRAQQALTGIWGDALSEWVRIFARARVMAATLPFGGLCEFHERFITTKDTKSTQEESLRDFSEAIKDGVFDPQIQALVDAAAEYLYGDGLNLSGRIWQLDRNARDGMNQMIGKAISDGSSAWQLAQDLEQYLGADADCPRWTSTRLYKRTKSEIAGGDLTGLVTNPNCDGQGVSYNALRLARTEIQKAHALATDRVMQNSPWVEKEKVNLSAQHPETDICDDVTSGGEKGEGVYPVGEIELPLHPNCLCFKTAVLMEEKAFTSEINSWLKGSSTALPGGNSAQNEFSQKMDDYARFLGVEGNEVTRTDLSNDPALIKLGVWLFGQELNV